MISGTRARVPLDMLCSHVTGNYRAGCSSALLLCCSVCSVETEQQSMHESPLYIAMVVDQVVRSFVLNLKYRSQR